MRLKWLVRATILVLIAASTPLAALALPGFSMEQPQNVDAGLWQTLIDGGVSDAIIQFAEQADLSAAYGLDWKARGEYVVKALQAVAQRTQGEALAYVGALGLEYQTFIAGNELYVFSAKLEAVSHLSSLRKVAYVRAPETFYLDPIISDAPQPLATTDWGILDTKANQFWTVFAHRGEGIVVANIDSGVQWNHPALINQFKCPGAPADPACWYDPKNICGAGGACDNNGHGTHTMGTMVAADDPGLVYIAGMAPHAKWIACKGCESNTCSDLALSACADWLLQPGGNPANRPHVVNNSWGGGGGNPWYKAKVRAWLAAGIFPAFSAGNSGPLCRSLGSPGDYQESFATAGHQKANRSIATWSSRGPSRYGHAPYTKPNISAPGANICSTVPTNGWNCGYSGTSMASPHSAGAVALLWSCNPALIGQVQQTAELLQNNADAAPTGRCGAPPDGQGNYTYGYGYLNVLKAGQSTCP